MNKQTGIVLFKCDLNSNYLFELNQQDSNIVEVSAKPRKV